MGLENGGFEPELLKKVLEASKALTGGLEETALCLYGSRVAGYAREDSDYNVLILLDQYGEGVRYYSRDLNGREGSCLIADKELFEMDVKAGSLGEFLAGRLIPPYLSLKGKSYLWRMEVALKKRICLEEMEELILEHGELSRGLMFKPEYVAISRMKRRMMVYPPLRYSYTMLLTGGLKEKNMKRIMPGFKQALKELESEGTVKLENGLIQPSDNFVDKVLSRRSVERVVNVLERSRRAIHTYLMHGRAGRVNLDSLAKELTFKLARGLLTTPEKLGFEDPRRFLYLKTALGLTSMGERSPALKALEGFRRGVKAALKPLGGALNEVYLATVDDERFVVKRFSDWYAFKWFPLNIVALGARYFSVSGRERLSNEYGMTCYMSDRGLPVQRILHVNLQEKTLIKEYLDGVDYSKLVRKALKSNSPEEDSFQEAGTFMAHVHSYDVTLGDAKPENLLLGFKGVIALDLEQASKGGDKAWDIAEFLYYAGHYSLTLSEGAKTIAQRFIEGYLKEGDPSTLRKAAGLNYIKVFSFWTPTIILWYYASQLKEAAKRR
jgi:tRNA A-37 threonylcarbamoyl transferase component Bud32